MADEAKARMSESKFTPGPWRLEWDNFGDGEGRQPIIVEDRKPANLIAAVYDASGDGLAGKNDTENAAGSAHLIAAAPKLYAALANILNCPQCRPKPIAENGHLDEARAALREARGEP